MTEAVPDEEAAVTSKPILFATVEVPPARSASAFIMRNLAKAMPPDSAVLVGDRPRGPLPAPGADGLQVRYLTRSLGLRWRPERFAHLLQWPLLLLRLWWMLRRRSVAAVLGVFPDAHYVSAACLAARWTGTPFYVYFHNFWLENTRGLPRFVAACLQPLVFRTARHVFVMSEGMAEVFRERYPSVPCSPLKHILEAPVPAFTPPVFHAPLQLVLMGSIYANCKDATCRLVRALSHIENAHLTFISEPRPDLHGTEDLMRGRITFRSVPAADVMSALHKADILLLPHGFCGSLDDVEYRTIFPTRLIPYLVSLRPILAHTPPGCYLTRFLREHGCALVVEEPCEEKLIRAVETLRMHAGMRDELVKNALRAAQLFSADKVVPGFMAQLGND